MRLAWFSKRLVDPTDCRPNIERTESQGKRASAIRSGQNRRRLLRRDAFFFLARANFRRLLLDEFDEVIEDLVVVEPVVRLAVEIDLPVILAGADAGETYIRLARFARAVDDRAIKAVD